MAAEAFVFSVYNPTTGAPIVGVAGSMSFLTFKDDLGNNVSAPTIVEVGGGLYKFTPAFAIGRAQCFVISAGSNLPQFLAGSVRPEDFSQWAFAPSPAILVFGIYDLVSGSPKTGVTPTFSTYDDQNGVPQAQPTITEIGGGLYGFIPSFATVNEIAFTVNTTANPSFISGYARVEDFSSTGFSVISALGTPTSITLSFASGFTLDALSGFVSNPANWSITGAPGVAVTAVNLSSNQIVLTTTTQGNGVSYTVNIPLGITANGGVFPMLGPFSIAFTGSTGDPILVQARSVDERIVDVFFSFAPIPSRATDATNYSIAPSLTISAIQMMSPTWYRITTSPQTIGTSYTITWPLH